MVLSIQSMEDGVFVLELGGPSHICPMENNTKIAGVSNFSQQYFEKLSPFEKLSIFVWNADYEKLKQLLKAITLNEEQFHSLIVNAVDNCLLSNRKRQVNLERYRVFKKLLIKAGYSYKEKFGETLFFFIS